MRIGSFLSWRALAACGALLALGVIAADAASPAPSITVLSSRPDLVSGGSALVRVAGGAADKAAITLNGANVSAVFRPDAAGMTGLVSGLKDGDNILAVQGGPSIVLKNHPITGPLLSGPQEQPFYCMTEKFPLPASTQTLGPALDADCSVKTRVDYVYRNTAGKFASLPDGIRPADLAQTKTSEGKTVPYIVRVETGTINRAIYQTAVLSDPAADKMLSPTAPPAAWNYRLVYTFGGGCQGGWFIQGRTVGNRGILEDLMLRQGYGVASSTLNVHGNDCNIAVSAETASMVKEQFIKSYGPVKFTIGYGCSGGTQQLHPITDEYPGLVDGIIVGCSFPEVFGNKVVNLEDADLIGHYLAKAKLAWTDAQKAAVAGYPDAATIAEVGPEARRAKVQGGDCNAIIPKDKQFDRAANPSGTRCDIYDKNVNIFGRDPATGNARRPDDNVGIQYGLGALNSGVITKAQFLDLNAAIGGYDQDGNYAPARMVGDPQAIAAAYRTGQITYAGLGLKSTPIIDYRAYADQPDNSGEVHSRYHSFVMRERLREVNGSFANQVMLVEGLTSGPDGGLFSDESLVLSHALTQMDEWLTGLGAGDGHRPSLQQMVKAKPADLTDACFTDGGRTKIAELQVYRGKTRCNALYPAFASAHLVAGEPLAANILKCQLKPVSAADYKVKFSAAELQQVKAIFPDGVCDFSKPGVGQVPNKAVWQSF